MSHHILIVDDDPEHLAIATRILGPEKYEISTARDGEKALALLESEPVDLVLSDVDMPQMGGLELLEQIQKKTPEKTVVMMSGLGSVDIAVQAVRSGAFDFVQKPLDVERLRLSIANALRVHQLEEVNAELRREHGLAEELVGESRCMARLRSMIERVAPTDGRVLIQGENGTGKGLIANSIHRASNRRRQPLVKVNCGALPENLVESELFGHEKGAFTGATSRRKGRFELADGGTLFLDEIGEMSPDMQVKLLRVIQEGQFERVGGSQTITVDVRLIAATNRDLPQLIEEGGFREDLYYRLDVVSLVAPPLRERREDIPILIEHLLQQRPVSERPILAEDALAQLMEHSFPGNVRELQNIVDRLSIFYPGERVTREMLGETIPRPRSATLGQPEGPARLYRKGVSYRERLQELERELLAQALEEHEGNKSATAAALGTDKSFFYRKCRQFDLG